MSAGHSLPVLGREQLDAYRRDGYIVLPDIFGPDELNALRSESDRLVDWQVNASLALGRVSPRCDIRFDPSGPVLLKIQPLSDVSAPFSAVANDPRLLAPMSQLLGCEPLLLEEKLNGKERLLNGVGELDLREWAPAFPFHTDLHYFVLDGYPEETLSTAVALDDCPSETGPLRLVPGSHLRKDWPVRDTWPPDLVDGVIADEASVSLTCSAGTVVMFHSRLVHASSRNVSGRPRRLLIYSHYPSSHEVDRDARNRDLRTRSRAFEAEYAERAADGYRPVPVRAATLSGFRLP